MDFLKKRLKRLTSMGLALLLSASAFPATAFAASDSTSTLAEVTAKYIDAENGKEIAEQEIYSVTHEERQPQEIENYTYVDYTENVEYVYSHKDLTYIVGYPDESVRPDASMTRAEATTVFYRLYDGEYPEFERRMSNGTFEDVKTDYWFYKEVETLYNIGIVDGTDEHKFSPDAPVTRAEFAVMAARFANLDYEGGNLFDDVPNGHWAYSYGCPYCEDHKLLKGFNDFASQYPQLAKEWSEKNKVGADAVTSSKAGLFWWHCPSCGGEYSAWISSRIDGSRCPYCVGRVVEENLNSLSKTHPAIAVEWNCEKNGTITPDQVSALSKQEYWWKSSCGHEWKAKIYDRTVRKVPCPKCEQEFVYVLPQLLVMLYTGQNHLKVEFDTDDLTGIRMEMYIPELNLAIEERSTDERNHEQKVKRYICELQDVRYILYEPFKSAEDAAAFIRTILKEHHVHIKTAAADDIALCREKYNLMKRRKLR